MTNHAATRSQATIGSSIGASIARLHRNWKARRQLRLMLEFDERQLRDIGVTRDEIARAVQLPLSVNAALELESVSGRRRRAQRLAGIWL